MTQLKIFSIPFFLFAILFVITIGCGPKKEIGNVSGSVKLDGQPLNEQAKVVIHFQNETTGQGNGAFLNPDGSFKVNSLEVGNYMIAITADIVPAMEPDDPLPVKTNIPERYSDCYTSDLKFNVLKGENTFDIELTKKKK